MLKLFKKRPVTLISAVFGTNRDSSGSYLVGLRISLPDSFDFDLLILSDRINKIAKRPPGKTSGGLFGENWLHFEPLIIDVCEQLNQTEIVAIAESYVSGNNSEAKLIGYFTQLYRMANPV